MVRNVPAGDGNIEKLFYGEPSHALVPLRSLFAYRAKTQERKKQEVVWDDQDEKACMDRSEHGARPCKDDQTLFAVVWEKSPLYPHPTV